MSLAQSQHNPWSAKPCARLKMQLSASLTPLRRQSTSYPVHLTYCLLSTDPRPRIKSRCRIALTYSNPATARFLPSLMLVVVAESKMKEKKKLKEIKKTENFVVPCAFALLLLHIGRNLVCRYLRRGKSAMVEEAPLCSTPSFCAELCVCWRYAIRCWKTIRLEKYSVET